MKRLLSAFFAGIFGLTGCTTFLPEPNATIKADAITFAILTELYCATKDLRGYGNQQYFASNDYWIAEIDMNLSASIEGIANPGLSLLGPFNMAKAIPAGGTTGSFTSVFSGTFDETRTKLREYKLYVYLKRLLNGQVSNDGTQVVPDWATFARSQNWPVDCTNPNAGGTYLQGQLGLKDWLLPALYTQEATVGYAPINAPAAQTPQPQPPAPTITDIYPSSGPASGGQQVFISGANLDTAQNIWFGKSDPQTPGQNSSSTMLIVTSPPAAKAAPDKAGTVDVVVQTPSGYATKKYTYDESAPLVSPNALQKAVVANLANTPAPPASGPPAGTASTSPTVSGTFTFQIKSTGTIGPSFSLVRVSGGASNLFTMTRNDNNYVIVSVTAANYCPLSDQIPSPKTCATLSSNPNSKPNDVSLNNALTRLDTTTISANLARLAP